jgi:hypothetical protein
MYSVLIMNHAVQCVLSLNQIILDFNISNYTLYNTLSLSFMFEPKKKIE